MDEHSGGSKNTFFGLIFFMIIAVGALAAFKFNLFSVQDMLTGANKPDDQQVDVRPNNDKDTTTEPVRPKRDPQAFPANPPSDEPYRKHRDTPLPELIEVPVKVGEYTAGITMRLVPQGWFIMGENDGIVANGPKRWVWMDDYYLAETETTNAQYYAFVLDNGYTRQQYWTPEGFAYIHDAVRARGNQRIGWLPLHNNRRLWALSSPRNDTTLEILDAEVNLPLQDIRVLVLPRRAAWTNYMYVNEGDGQIYFRVRDEWQLMTGRELLRQPQVLESDYLYTTDRNGRVELGQVRDDVRYTVVAWIDGLENDAVFGNFSHAGSSVERGPSMPVTGLSWFEADAVARYLGGALPTEAQWEKAARGTDGRWFPWNGEIEWGLELAGSTRLTTPHANVNRWQLMPVGSFPGSAGPYGHLDMVGNASEWCLDVYMSSPQWAVANPVNRGRATTARAERGTSTEDDDATTARAYNRRQSDPYSRTLTRGFRLAMTPEQALKHTTR